MASKIVFSPKLPAALLDTARALVPAGFEMVVVDAGTPEFTAALPDAQYYVGFPRAELSSEFFKAAPGLKLIQLISAGYDRLDVDAARRAGVPIANNGGSNSVAVAEHTLMLMLAVLKRAFWLHRNVVAGRWRVGGFDENRLFELSGKTVGIVGLGNIGKKVARRVRAFDAQVIYYDIVRLSEAEEDALGVRFVLLEELLRTADVVTLHVPLTSSTQNLITTRTLGLMKPSAVLINTCRGPVVDETALHRALSSGQIAAAGLDVMIEEPPAQKHPLFGLDNVIITPHMAGPTWENWPRAFRNSYDNVQRVAAGRPPLWVIPELRA
ncbi:MAG TPA: 2-hydroxyacid dehydrogenase [Methylomirabilota bacterium]|nr:2-hydroxyacid dehydrogenase [Methylomirabilota bacterium]